MPQVMHCHSKIGGKGGFKSPMGQGDKRVPLRGPTCQGILGLVVFVFVFFSAKLFHSAPLSAATLLPTMEFKFLYLYLYLCL